MKRIVGRLLLMIVVLAALFAIYRLLTIEPRPVRAYLEGPRPLVMAHQGGGDLAPGDTMAAFENAVRLGADVLELDVHTTAEGVVVVIHDDTVDRTTNGSGAVHEFTLAELQTFDAGYSFSRDEGQTFPYRDQGVQIPTLDAVLAAFQGLRVNIEIKQADPPMEAAVLRVIDQAGARSRVLVVSSNDDVIRRFRDLAPDVATGASEAEVRSFYFSQILRISALFRLGADALQVPEYSGNIHVVTRSFVDAAHARGVAVHVWTVNDVTSMRRLLDLGVDGLITDRPDLALEVLHRANN